MVKWKKPTYITKRTKTSVKMNVKSSQCGQPGRSKESKVSGLSDCSDAVDNVQTENEIVIKKLELDVEMLMIANEQVLAENVKLREARNRITFWMLVRIFLVIGMMVIFTISFIFECWRIFEEIEAEKRTILRGAPECENEKTRQASWKFWFKGFYSSPCAAYDRVVETTTIIQIDPLTVFIDLISRFLFRPLKHIGLYLGQFTYQFLSQLPWVHQYMFPILTFILPFMYFFGRVLDINMPYGFGSINIRR